MNESGEPVDGRWACSTIHCSTTTLDRATGHFYSAVAVPPKLRWCPLYRRLARAPERVSMLGEGGLGPRACQHAGRRWVGPQSVSACWEKKIYCPTANETTIHHFPAPSVIKSEDISPCSQKLALSQMNPVHTFIHCFFQNPF